MLPFAKKIHTSETLSKKRVLDTLRLYANAINNISRETLKKVSVTRHMLDNDFVYKMASQTFVLEDATPLSNPEREIGRWVNAQSDNGLGYSYSAYIDGPEQRTIMVAWKATFRNLTRTTSTGGYRYLRATIDCDGIRRPGLKDECVAQFYNQFAVGLFNTAAVGSGGGEVTLGNVGLVDLLPGLHTFSLSADCETGGVFIEHFDLTLTEFKF